MKKRNRNIESGEENAFALSTGDLMAGLLFIFILLLMGAMLQVQEKAEQDEEIDDLSFMEGYQLNTETLLYNEILENWPAKILCKDDCKGLCPVCGKNRNDGDCGCDTFVPDPRMAAIKDVFNACKEV